MGIVGLNWSSFVIVSQIHWLPYWLPRRRGRAGAALRPLTARTKPVRTMVIVAATTQDNAGATLSQRSIQVPFDIGRVRGNFPRQGAQGARTFEDESVKLSLREEGIGPVDFGSARVMLQAHTHPNWPNATLSRVFWSRRSSTETATSHRDDLSVKAPLLLQPRSPPLSARRRRKPVSRLGRRRQPSGSSRKRWFDPG